MKDRSKVLVIKASGSIVPFSEEKLLRSLKRSGASDSEAAKVMAEINKKLFEGISTKTIYKMAFKLLKEQSTHLAAKYHLKGAIMELGPSGFPFEKYFSEILRYQGYKTTVGEIVQGKCVSHEIDVIAELGEQFFMIECKYHNQPGTFSDVKIPLYIQSRFKDVEAQWIKLPGHENKTHTGWVVTNTRFSTDAVLYGNCIGLKLLGWDYPVKEGLKDLIDRLGLYPITCLTTLTKVEKQLLLDKNIVLCKEISDDVKLLDVAGVNPTRAKRVLEEVEKLCQHLISIARI